MLDHARAALAKLDLEPACEWIVLTARASAGDVRRLACDSKSASFSWDPGDLTDKTDTWNVRGYGELACVAASGPQRWSRVRAEAATVFAATREIREDGVVAPRLRFFGGASFHPDVRDPMWRDFGSASFVLPRWSFGVRDGGDAFVRFAFRREERRDVPRLLAEIAEVTSVASVESERAGDGRRPSTPPEDDASWAPLVESALASIARGDLEKVVAARRTFVEGRVSPRATRVRLREQNPRATVFSFRRGESTFLGATPERLIFSDKERVFTEAIAGTIARRDDDDAAREALLASDKDLREHRIVVGGIVRALAPFTRGIDLPASPAIRTLGRLHHLATPIVAPLAGKTHVLALVEALHPTPALSGYPKKTAFEWIAAHEPFERGWYGAPVGWFDDEGEGSFVVAIRSALIVPERTWLFAGGGIVRGSVPTAELAETVLKLRTMSEALVPA